MNNNTLKQSLALITAGFILHTQGSALDLDAAMQRVIAQSPTLLTAETEICIRDAEKEQVSYFINPSLSIESENIGTGEKELGVYITQELELGGKRSARARFANTAEYLAYCDYEIAKRDIFTKLRHAFIDAAAAQEKLKIAEDQKRIAEQTQTCASQKVEAGKANPIELLKARISCNDINRSHAKAASAAFAARIKVAAIWQSGAPDFDTIEYPLDQISQPPTFDMAAASFENTPDYTKQSMRIELTCDGVSLERAKRIPNVAVSTGASGGSEKDDRGMYIGFEMPIPLFDQNGGNIRRAQLERNQAIFQKQEFLNESLSRLQVLCQELQVAYHDVIAIRDVAMPSIAESFEISTQGYQNGKIEYLMMLDAQKTLYEIKGAYIDALAEYHHKRTDLERMTRLWPD